jgi:hypothetical protein
MKKGRFIVSIIGVYALLYSVAYNVRTRGFSRDGGAPAYWGYTAAPSDFFEASLYAVFFPAYRAHREIIGIGEIHIRDPKGYPKYIPDGSEIYMKETEPNKAMEQSRILVTERAFARSAPSIRLAHLRR